MKKEEIKTILENNDDFDASEISSYVESLPDECDHLTCTCEITDDFLWWKEQQEIETDKILDANHWASL